MLSHCVPAVRDAAANAAAEHPAQKGARGCRGGVRGPREPGTDPAFVDRSRDPFGERFEGARRAGFRQIPAPKRASGRVRRVRRDGPIARFSGRRRSPISTNRATGSGDGSSLRRADIGAETRGGSKGGRSHPLPGRSVQHCVGWLPDLTASDKPVADASETRPTAASPLAEHPRETLRGTVQRPLQSAAGGGNQPPAVCEIRNADASVASRNPATGVAEALAHGRYRS